SSTTLRLRGTQLSDGAIDFDQLTDVSTSLSGVYQRTSFTEDTSVLHVDLAVSNQGQYPVDGPLLVGITHLSDPAERVRDADGVTPDGIPYYDFASLLADGTLAPGAATASRRLEFFNPGRGRFTYDVVVLGRLNQAPAFTSVPGVEGLAGHTYTYTPK